MSKMKVIVAGSALGAAILTVPSFAAVTGTVAATSEYVFRGIDSENGAAIQGSLDWADGGGLYAGTWMSNAGAAGGNELDLYGGYKFALSEGMELDLGGIYYVFTEDEEGGFNDFDTDYLELYAGLNIGGFAAKVYYTNDFFGVDGQPLFASGALTGQSADGASTYVNLSYTYPIKEGLNIKAAVGSQSGDGADAFYGDSVTDYGLSLTKSLENGVSVSFGVYGTDLDLAGTESKVFDNDDPFEDKAKFVVTIAKGFDI